MINMSTGIYKWTSPSNKYYIGQAVNLERRKKEFLQNPYKYTYTSKNSAIDRARLKYNDYTQWKYEIMEFTTVNKLNDREIFYISKFKSNNSRYGYNATNGGDGVKGVRWGSKKQVEALKKRRNYNGSNNPNYGKHHTEETKLKISKSKIGKKLSAKTILKISKPINQYTKNGVFVNTWISIAEASRVLNIDKSSICRVCKGKKNSAGNYIWKYIG